MTTLDELCGLAGIEPGYSDIWGNHFEIPATTKAALLKAMGVCVDSPEACEESLAELRTKSWRRMLEPVAVIEAEAQPGSVTVTLPASCGGNLSWRLDIEDGGTNQGSAAIDYLDVVDVASIDNETRDRRRLLLPAGLPEGYHRLEVWLDDPINGGTQSGLDRGTTMLIVAPAQCWSPDHVTGDGNPRFWGLSCQLYALRNGHNWGIGNLDDLGALAERAAERGADFIGLNPLHALFPAAPNQCSPYSPSSRLYLNTLYLDVEAIDDFVECAEARAVVADGAFRSRLEEVRNNPIVDYPQVASLADQVLRLCYGSFRKNHVAAGGERSREFDAFRSECGDKLRRFATFHALQAHLIADGDESMMAWSNWPEAFRISTSTAVAEFAEEHQEEIAYLEYLQWQTDVQLARTKGRARDAGMRIGLYLDLAVGITDASASRWANQEGYADGVSVGAPPDQLNLLGQVWGLCPLNPLTLREMAYDPMIAAMRRNMRHAGALRIDHVMGLMRQFWVPNGVSGREGAYVRFPFEELRRILALESQRNRCLIIGEDLGTVPEGFRPAMEESGVLSYRVMQFERVGDGLFKRPDAYPASALVTAATHDLPTLTGFWEGCDLEWRRKLNLYPDEEMAANDSRARVADRQRMLDALIDAGLWSPDDTEPVDTQKMNRRLLAAIHGFLARSPSRLMVIQIEDTVGQREQQNLPGTIYEHPNWCRKLSRPVAEIFADAEVRALLDTIATNRRST